jgi:hypothetical protein
MEQVEENWKTDQLDELSETVRAEPELSHPWASSLPGEVPGAASVLPIGLKPALLLLSRLLIFRARLQCDLGDC